MNIKLIPQTPLSPEPVTLDMAKVQCRYTNTDQDTYINGLIVGARKIAEFYNGRQMTQKQWDLALDRWPGSPGMGISALPDPYFGSWPSDSYRLTGACSPGHHAISLMSPLVSVDLVNWKDSSANVTTLTENTDYIVDTWKEPGIICPYPGTTWPMGPLWPSSAVHVQFTAGFTPDQVPQNIQQGILLLVAQWFVARIPFDAIRVVAEVPFSVTSLFTSDKLWV